MKKIAFALLIASAIFASPKAVVFDYGDVLAFRRSEFLDDFLCRSLKITSKALEEAKCLKRNSMLRDQDFWKQLATIIGSTLQQEWESAYNKALLDSLGPDPEMYGLIETLKEEGVRVGLLTNIEKKYAKIAEGFGLFDLFSPKLLACDIGVKKPDPRAYQILIDALGMKPEEIIFIDDNQANIDAALKSGLDAVVFKSSQQVKQDLEKRGLLCGLKKIKKF